MTDGIAARPLQPLTVKKETERERHDKEAAEKLAGQ